MITSFPEIKRPLKVVTFLQGKDPQDIYIHIQGSSVTVTRVTQTISPKAENNVPPLPAIAGPVSGFELTPITWGEALVLRDVNWNPNMTLEKKQVDGQDKTTFWGSIGSLI